MGRSRSSAHPQGDLASSDSTSAVEPSASVSQGGLGQTGALGVDVRVQQLQIGPSVRAVSPDAAVPEGQLALELSLGGTLQQPQGKGALQLTSLTWQGRTLGEMRARWSWLIRPRAQTCAGASRDVRCCRCKAMWVLSADGAWRCRFAPRTSPWRCSRAGAQADAQRRPAQP